MAGVTDKVRFRQDTDISEASVLTLYLLASINRKLRPRILSEMKPGARVVSCNFDMGNWEPYRVARVDDRPIYLWIVPER